MYLTRFRINTARTGARRLLGSPHRLHGAVNAAFPDLPARDGTGPRVLWRLDPAPGDRLDLLISSPARPDLTHLAEQAGWPSLGTEGWKTFAYGEFLGALAQGDVWAFRLTANPVHYIRRDQDPVDSPTKRTAHVTVRHQIGWLLKHQDRAGFSVLPRELALAGAAAGAPGAASAEMQQGSGPGQGAHGASLSADSPKAEPSVEFAYHLTVHNRQPTRFAKPTEDRTRSAGNDVRFTQATFDGRLRITDLDAFRRTLTQGLGKAKAYGCGLMTLAPVR